MMDIKGIERGARRRSFAVSPIVPLLVFIISTAIAGLTFMLPIALTSQEYVNSRLYLYGTIAQLLMDLPAVFILVRSRWPLLGSKRECRAGIAVGLVGAALLAALRLVLRGRLVFMERVPAFGQGLALPLPWNLLASVLTVLAYGPGEALIQVYLILALDEAVGQHDRDISLGVLANAVLWGLGHIAAVFTYGWSAVFNALLMLAIGIATGMMFKKTRSAIAPIVFWTLINGTSV
jgi:hypothetical protein